MSETFSIVKVSGIILTVSSIMLSFETGTILRRKFEEGAVFAGSCALMDIQKRQSDADRIMQLKSFNSSNF